VCSSDLVAGRNLSLASEGPVQITSGNRQLQFANALPLRPGKTPYEKIDELAERYIARLEKDGWDGPAFQEENMRTFRFSYRSDEEYWTRQPEAWYESFWMYLVRRGRLTVGAQTYNAEPWTDRPIRGAYPWPGTEAYRDMRFNLLGGSTNVAEDGTPRRLDSVESEGRGFTPASWDMFSAVVPRSNSEDT
jgi:hypothetical protein